MPPMLIQPLQVFLNYGSQIAFGYFEFICTRQIATIIKLDTRTIHQAESSSLQLGYDDTVRAFSNLAVAES